MHKFIIKAFIITFLLMSQLANAGLITFDKKSLRGESLNDDLRASWESNSNDIFSRTIDTFNYIDIGNQSIGHININFDLVTTNNWTLDFGLDAGLGAELYVNDVLVIDRSDNLWWKRKWTHSDVFSLSNFEFTPGMHNIDLYFAENCCDGLSSIRMTNNVTQEISMLSVDSLQRASVPEPSTVVLFSLALAGIAARRKLA